MKTSLRCICVVSVPNASRKRRNRVNKGILCFLVSYSVCCKYLFYRPLPPVYTHLAAVPADLGAGAITANDQDMLKAAVAAAVPEFRELGEEYVVLVHVVLGR